MAQVIMHRDAPQPDNSIAGMVLTFIAKLMADDTAPGLHIEPINGSADHRVRTGRVNKQWRALLAKIQGQGEEAHYVYLGTFNHDDAIAKAKKYRVEIDSKGIANLIKADEATRARPGTDAAARKPKPDDVDTASWSRLHTQGIGVDDLVTLGIERAIAEAAITATDDDTLQELAAATNSTWQGNAMLDLAFGTPLEDVVATYAVERSRPITTEPDDALLAALRHPSARMEFAFLENDDDLRAAIENPDFSAWRTYLHPDQRRYAMTSRTGSFRVTGGAGTGKTVILLHRARHLARQNPTARVVLTTYNTTLADSLRDNLRLLDSEITIAPDLGAPGIYIASVDAVARRVLTNAKKLNLPLQDAVTAVLGERDTSILGNTDDDTWRRAVAASGVTLPAHLIGSPFLNAEYATCVLPQRITSADQYVRATRRGRGVPLGRAERVAVWQAIQGYRAIAALTGTTSYEEKEMIAATALDLGAERGATRPADHVLVDEAQDLSPARLLMLRALVASGRDDLFLAEDSQQRIYGQKIVLAHYGVKIQGRSRRLKVNYRTTAQNLAFALSVLGGTTSEDIDGDVTETSGYRSVRRGPTPEFYPAKNRAEEYTTAARVLKKWLDGGDAPEELGVLMRTSRDTYTLLDALKAAGVPGRHVANREKPAKGSISVMTMHRAKGMEFRRVLLVGMSSAAVPINVSSLPPEERADALQRERSLVYVATTRARDELAITWSGNRSSLVPSSDGPG